MTVTHRRGEAEAMPGHDLAAVLGGQRNDCTAAASAILATAAFDCRAIVLEDGEGWKTLAGTAGYTADTLPEGLSLVRHDTSPAAAIICGELQRVQRVQLLQALAWIGLHHQADAARSALSVAHQDVDVLRAVTEQLRSVHDLDQVLHLIATRTLDLLDADICGVMLLDGEVLRMRACVGHRVADTAKLRMAKGHGVAGLVLQTGRAAKVDDYLDDAKISKDFVPLAVSEATKSALAVPLILKGELIGVLEVWRRRASTFTDRDVSRLTNLADFASIAIDNARLVETLQASMEELQEARRALEIEVQLSRKTAELQVSLLDDVLDNPTMASIADVVARLRHYAVAIFGPDGRTLVSNGPADLAALLPDTLGRPRRSAAWLSEPDEAGTGAYVHPVMVKDEYLGSVVLVGTEPNPDLIQLACAQVALACSLAQLQERVASHARSGAIEHALWDLLEGTLDQRVAARSRAQRMGVSFGGAHRVVAAHVDGLTPRTEAGALEPSGSSDRSMAMLARQLRTDPATPPNTVVTFTGYQLVALVERPEAAAVREVIDAWNRALNDGAASVTWGASRSYEDPLDLNTAYQEARTALTAARRLGSRNVALYDELGIVRLLLGSGSDPDLRGFIDEVTGPLLSYDAEHDGSLILTLRTFFDSDCSQRVAAERLFIHHKTMRYRLERIKQLTGLDLSRHQDRLRADVALRILQVNHDPNLEHGRP